MPVDIAALFVAGLVLAGLTAINLVLVGALVGSARESRRRGSGSHQGS
jgi:hypothetical protein